MDNPSFDQSKIRNFCIIAHIDHGKSTLADRLLEASGAVSQQDLMEQHLDTLELERERGITIKAQTVRLSFENEDGPVAMNLIDTPGHVDFENEVSRSLMACEGVLLVVDAVQGVQAQTLAHAWQAVELGLDVIPVVNKIDAPAADPSRVSVELEALFGFKSEEAVFVSAKTGEGLEELIRAIIQRVRPPSVNEGSTAPRALVFDSRYDLYRGVVAHVRVFDGSFKEDESLRLLSSQKVIPAPKLGFFSPDPVYCSELKAGEVGFVVTGLKSLQDVRVGDSLTAQKARNVKPLKGYRPRKPMVFAGLYPASHTNFSELRDGLEKLRLNDAALEFEPESSVALGFGFRCGFLGALHLEVVRERLEREYGLNIITTIPSVQYEILLTDGSSAMVGNPSKMPDPGRITEVREPRVLLYILAPSRFLGTIIELLKGRRGEFVDMEYIQVGAGNTNIPSADSRVRMEFNAPLSELLADFHDALKSATSGYASMDYKHLGMFPEKLVKLDILVNREPVDALSLIIHRSAAEARGRELVSKLRELIPRQLFEVPLQAAVGGRIVARENIKALRKNVLAKCYGGDVTRKRKLLQRQAEGKKRMKMVGKVEVPQEAFMAALKLNK